MIGIIIAIISLIGLVTLAAVVELGSFRQSTRK